MAFTLEKTISFSKTCSAIPQNLAVNNISEGIYNVSVIRKNSVCLSTFAPDDVSTSRVVEPNEKSSDTEVIYQARWVKLGKQNMFVVSSTRGFQVYEADGMSLAHFESFMNEKKKNDIENVSARCASSIGGSRLLIGRSDGAIYSYNYPFNNPKNTSFICGHSALTGIASDTSEKTVASCDDFGKVAVWTVNNGDLALLSKTKLGSGWPAVAIAFWRKWILVGLMNGVVLLLNSKDLSSSVEILAHFRSLMAIDVIDLPSFGLLLTGSEDTNFRLFAIKENLNLIEVEQCASGIYPNQLICGACFLLPTNEKPSLKNLKIALSSYESNHVSVFKIKLES